MFNGQNDVLNTTANKARTRNERGEDVTYISLAPDAPDLFAFPKNVFRPEALAQLSSRHLRSLRLCPLVTVKTPNLSQAVQEKRAAEAARTGNTSTALDTPAYKLDLMRTRDGLPLDTPLYWAQTPLPDTMYLTAVMKDPKRIMDIMVKRSCMDLLSTFHTNPLQWDVDESGEGADTDPLLQAWEGRHIWRPGEVYATAYGAPKIYPVTQKYALKPSGNVWLTAISPRAALAAQRISVREAHYLLTGASLAEGFGLYNRPLSAFKTLITLSGGYGGGSALPIGSGVRGGGIAENYPVQRLMPLKANSFKTSLHLALTLGAMPDTEKTHSWSLTTLLTVEQRNRMARWSTLQAKAKKMAAMLLETMTLGRYCEIDYSVDSDTPPTVQHAKYRRFYTELAKFLEDFVNSTSAFERACKAFTNDAYSFTWARTTHEGILPFQFTQMGPSVRLKAFESMWLSLLVYHNYVESHTRRMSAHELYLIATTTGIPIQCMLRYFYEYEERTGIWLPQTDIEEQLLDLLTAKWDGIPEAELGVKGNPYNSPVLSFSLEMVIEELRGMVDQREMLREQGDLKKRMNAATNAKDSNPLTLAAVLTTPDGEITV